MLRSLGGFIALISAMLCIGVIVLGVRSRHCVDVLLINTPWKHVAGAATDHGAILFAHSDLPFDAWVSTDGTKHSIGLATSSAEDFTPIRDTILDKTAIRFSFLGFQTASGQAAMTSQLSPGFLAVRIPCWLLAIVFAILPLSVVRARWIRGQRKRKGLCLACGYDLRFSEGRCPECGKMPSGRKASALRA
jgi:hypothetical protein